MWGSSYRGLPVPNQKAAVGDLFSIIGYCVVFNLNISCIHLSELHVCNTYVSVTYF
jgi:hypothetical protein